MTQRRKSQSIGLLMIVVSSAVVLWALAAMVQPPPVAHAEDPPPQIETITVTSTKRIYFYSPVLGEEGGEVYFNSVGGEGAGQVLTVTMTVTGSMPITFTGAPAFEDNPPSDTSNPWEITYTVEMSAETQSGIVFTVTNAGGTDRAVITFTQDITDPTIISPTLNEFSPFYLHADELMLYYGNVATPATFCVKGEAQDDGAGPYQVTYSEAFEKHVPETDDFIFPPYSWVSYYPVAAETDYGNGTITVTVSDHVGNSATQIFTYTRDITSPTLSGPTIVENSDYLYVHADGTTVYYSHQMGTPQSFTVQGKAADDGDGDAGLDRATFSAALGSVSYSSPVEEWSPADEWSRTYDDVEDTDWGNGTITVTVYDNVSNWSQQTFNYIEDTTNPTVTLTYVTLGGYDEDNPDDWLDADGSNWYNDDDFTGGNWEFTSYTDDDGAGLASGSASWDHSAHQTERPLNCGPDGDDIFSDVTGDDDGTVTVTVTIADHVGNSASDSVVFNIDNTKPTVTLPSISESSDYLHADGLTIYYGDDMGSVQPFTVNGSSNDTGVGLDRAEFSEAFNNTPAPEYEPSTWSRDYYPNSHDWGSGTIYVTIYDRLGNAAYQTFNYIRDTDPPTVDVNCPAVTSEPSFLVSWNNSIDPPPDASGLNHFDVQYKVGSDGQWQDWLMDTSLTEATFGPTSPVIVEDDHTYYFRVRAEDNVSNEQYTDGEDATTYHSGIKKVFLPILMAPDPNWGFELGDFTSWQHGGQLDQSVSKARSHSGNYSALLGSPSYPCNNVPIGSAWLRRSVTVPSSGSPTLSFHYRIFTQDKTSPQYLEVSDLGSVPSGDRFAVKINGEQLFADANTAKPEKREECETYLYPTPYDLDWQQGIVPLNNYKGQTIEITFHNYNWPDKWYNTYTYVDDVCVQ